ncbi:unnamed protein product [Alternaria alternata]
MSLPLANSTPNSSILNLPNELLLPIAKHLLIKPRFDQKAYEDLFYLAVTNSRFPRIVRSILQGQKALCIPLPKVHSLFRTLREFPAAQWADNIESLEITNYVSHGDNDGCMRISRSNHRENLIRYLISTGDMTLEDGQDRSKMPSRQYSIENDTSFRTGCLKAIREADGWRSFDASIEGTQVSGSGISQELLEAYRAGVAILMAWYRVLQDEAAPTEIPQFRQFTDVDNP